MPPRRFHRVAAYREVGLFGLRYRYSFRVFPEISQHNFNVERMAAIRFACAYSANPAALYSRRLTMSHESQPSASFVSGVGKLCPRPRAIADDESRITAEHVICFRGMQTVHVAARNERLTPPQRIVTQIIRDISRCPHGPVGSKLYCPAPYFYLPRDIGTCLSLSPGPVYTTSQIIRKKTERLIAKSNTRSVYSLTAVRHQL